MSPGKGVQDTPRQLPRYLGELYDTAPSRRPCWKKELRSRYQIAADSVDTFDTVAVRIRTYVPSKLIERNRKVLVPANHASPWLFVSEATPDLTDLLFAGSQKA